MYQNFWNFHPGLSVMPSRVILQQYLPVCWFSLTTSLLFKFLKKFSNNIFISKVSGWFEVISTCPCFVSTCFCFIIFVSFINIIPVFMCVRLKYTYMNVFLRLTKYFNFWTWFMLIIHSGFFLSVKCLNFTNQKSLLKPMALNGSPWLFWFDFSFPMRCKLSV